MINRNYIALWAGLFTVTVMQAKELPIFNESGEKLKVSIKAFGSGFSRPAETIETTVDAGATGQVDLKPYNLNSWNYFQSDRKDGNNIFSVTLTDMDGKKVYDGVPGQNVPHIKYLKKVGKTVSSSDWEANRPGKILHSNTHDALDKNVTAKNGIFIRNITDQSIRENWKEHAPGGAFAKAFSFNPDQKHFYEVSIEGHKNDTKKIREFAVKESSHAAHLVILEE